MARSAWHGRWNRRLLPLALAVALALPLVVAWHWQKLGWRDKHINYPRRPSGYAQIVDVFGQPCNDNASAIQMDWDAADDGRVYRISFHRKLGGMGTEFVKDQGGRSTNLDNDVFGHIQNQHLGKYVLRGVWGYVCRYINGTTSWSTHAWGIAVDVSSAYEHVGHYHSHVNYHHAPIWKEHNWYWGKAFGDAMHFQYADNY